MRRRTPRHSSPPSRCCTRVGRTAHSGRCAHHRGTTERCDPDSPTSDPAIQHRDPPTSGPPSRSWETVAAFFQVTAGWWVGRGVLAGTPAPGVGSGSVGLGAVAVAASHGEWSVGVSAVGDCGVVVGGEDVGWDHGVCWSGVPAWAPFAVGGAVCGDGCCSSVAFGGVAGEVGGPWCASAFVGGLVGSAAAAGGGASAVDAGSQRHGWSLSAWVGAVGRYRSWVWCRVRRGRLLLILRLRRRGGSG